MSVKNRHRRPLLSDGKESGNADDFVYNLEVIREYARALIHLKMTKLTEEQLLSSKVIFRMCDARMKQVKATAGQTTIPKRNSKRKRTTANTSNGRADGNSDSDDASKIFDTDSEIDNGKSTHTRKALKRLEIDFAKGRRKSVGPRLTGKFMCGNCGQVLHSPNKKDTFICPNCIATLRHGRSRDEKFEVVDLVSGDDECTRDSDAKPEEQLRRGDQVRVQERGKNADEAKTGWLCRDPVLLRRRKQRGDGFQYHVTFGFTADDTEVFPQTGKRFEITKVVGGIDFRQAQRQNGKVFFRKKHAAAQVARVNKMTKIKDNKVVITRFNFNISRRDMYSLQPNEWLNDNVVFFYLLLLKEGVKTTEKVHVFNTFFFSKLTTAPDNQKRGDKKRARRSHRGKFPFNYDAVKSWTDKFDLLSKTLVFIPINSMDGSHWSLIAVRYCAGEYEIYYYDSFDALGHPYKQTIKSYYTRELKERRGIEVGLIPGSHVCDRIRMMPDVTNRPKQTTSTDCGAFICAYAFCILNDIDIQTIQQKDMKFFRRHVALSILRGSIQDFIMYPIVDTEV